MSLPSPGPRLPSDPRAVRVIHGRETRVCVKPRKTDNGVVGWMASLGDENAKETKDGGSRGGEECQRRGMQIRNAWAESGRRRKRRRRTTSRTKKRRKRRR